METCRAYQCGMQFKTQRIRADHEQTLHKNMYEDAIDKILKQILATNSEADVNAPSYWNVEQSKHYSYAELAALDKATDTSGFRSMMTEVIKNWLDSNENSNINDFQRTVRFKIKKKAK